MTTSAKQQAINQAWMNYWNNKGPRPEGTFFTGSDQYAPEVSQMWGDAEQKQNDAAASTLGIFAGTADTQAPAGDWLSVSAKVYGDIHKAKALADLNKSIVKPIKGQFIRFPTNDETTTGFQHGHMLLHPPKPTAIPTDMSDKMNEEFNPYKLQSPWQTIGSAINAANNTNGFVPSPRAPALTVRPPTAAPLAITQTPWQARMNSLSATQPTAQPALTQGPSRNNGFAPGFTQPSALRNAEAPVQGPPAPTPSLQGPPAPAPGQFPFPMPGIGMNGVGAGAGIGDTGALNFLRSDYKIPPPVKNKQGMTQDASMKKNDTQDILTQEQLNLMHNALRAQIYPNGYDQTLDPNNKGGNIAGSVPTYDANGKIIGFTDVMGFMNPNDRRPWERSVNFPIATQNNAAQHMSAFQEFGVSGDASILPPEIPWNELASISLDFGGIFIDGKPVSDIFQIAAYYGYKYDNKDAVFKLAGSGSGSGGSGTLKVPRSPSTPSAPKTTSPLAQSLIWRIATG